MAASKPYAWVNGKEFGKTLWEENNLEVELYNLEEDIREEDNVADFTGATRESNKILKKEWHYPVDIAV